MKSIIPIIGAAAAGIVAAVILHDKKKAEDFRKAEHTEEELTNPLALHWSPKWWNYNRWKAHREAAEKMIKDRENGSYTE